MPISDRDRKILWGKAGNRCSKCRQVLVQPGEAEDSTDHAVVGEECHIISPRHGGPRGQFEMLGDLDGYSNLILLCPSDHTLVDQLPDDWPPTRLHAMKAAHESWVNERLSAPKPKPKIGVHREPPAALVELVTASDLVAVAMGVEESSLDHQDLEDEADVEVVAGFLQTVFDYSEMWSDYEPGERIRSQHELGRLLADLREQGWRLFGARGTWIAERRGRDSQPMGHGLPSRRPSQQRRDCKGRSRRTRQANDGASPGRSSGAVAPPAAPPRREGRRTRHIWLADAH